MINNGPISASAPGKSLTGALGADITFNTRYPFAKLDSTNLVSFQNIQLFFAIDTPNPDGVTSGYIRTNVYQFPHGYSYIPTVWMFYQRVGAGIQDTPSSTRFSPYGYWGGIIAAANISDSSTYATLDPTADATNVYIDVTKNAGVGSPDTNLVGYSLNIRLYIFVEDTLGGGVPTQP